MNRRSRISVTVLGVFFLYIAFLLLALRDLSAWVAPLPVAEVLGCALVGGLLVYSTAARLAEPASARGVAGITALLLYWLAPLQSDPRLLVQPWGVVRGGIWALAMARVWLSTEHWSTFMRGMVLTAVWAMGWVTAREAIPAAVLAFAVWMALNRRALGALAFACGVIGVGALAAELVLWLHDWAHVTAFDWRAASALTQARWSSGVLGGGWTYSMQSFGYGRRAAVQLSLPWLLLSLWSIWQRFLGMVRSRRSDSTGWLAVFAGAALWADLGRSGLAREEMRWLAAYTIAVVPLVAADIARREILLSRTMRASALFGFFFSFAAAVMVWALGPVEGLGEAITLGISAAALMAAYGVSHWTLGRGWLAVHYRGRATLIGATAGAWLAQALTLFRN